MSFGPSDTIRGIVILSMVNNIPIIIMIQEVLPPQELLSQGAAGIPEWQSAVPRVWGAQGHLPLQPDH